MIVLSIVVLYIVVLFLISAYSTKLVKGTTRGYLLANQEWSFWLVAVMLAGLAIGGASTIGISQRAFEHGLSAGWYDVAWGVGAIIVGIFGIHLWRKMDVTTIPEMLGKYYGTKARIIGVLLQIIIMLVILSLQFVAGGALLSSMLPRYFTLTSGMVVTAITFVGIATIGGLWAGGLANIINVLIIWVGISIGAIISWHSAGGSSIIIQKLPSHISHLNPLQGITIGVLVGWFIVMTTQAFSVQAIEQIGSAAKNPAEARKGFILGGLIMAPIGFLSALIGIAARAKYPHIVSVKALPTIIMSINPWLAGFVLSGLWAADISTGVGLLLGSATLAEKDILEWNFKSFREMSSTKKLLLTKITVLGIGILGLFLAFRAISVLKVLLIGLSATTPFTIIFLFTVYKPNFCKRPAAFWTILVGMLLLVVWELFPPIRVLPHPIYLEWIVCLPIFVIISSISDKKLLTYG